MPDFSGIDTSRIHAIIARARRRLRVQAALESATTASILALGAALVVVYLVRRHALDDATGLLLLGACAGLVVAGAVLGAMIRLPQHIVATRIDRASGLSDRLSTACAFEAQLATGKRPEDEQTEALMHAAIRDAVTAAPRANVVAATPFRRPRDGRAALVFGVLGLAVAGLYWPDPNAPSIVDPAAAAAAERDALAEKQRLEDDDVDYTRDLLEDMRRVAQAERDPSLEQFVSEIETLLAKAELGELSKEELLEKLARAEQQYMQGAAQSDEDIEQAMADLKDTGKELQKNEVTRELGKALEQGDMEAAQQQMEALAQKLEQGELSEQQKSEVARALEQAAKQFEQKEQQRDQALDKQIEQAKAEMERTEQQQDKAKNEQEKQKLTRKLESQKKQLEKLEQEKMQREQSAQRRNLKSLHRNLEQASKQMQQEGGEQQQQQRMASQNMRKAAEDAGQVDADQRKMAAQKKVASQLEDLKEAMRRAKQRGQNGPKDLFGKNQRNQDFLRRAQGQAGSRQAWRPGSQSGRISQGQPGQGQPGQQPGQQGQGQQGQGQQPGGQSYGDEHDPNVLGDATPRAGKTKDESVSGVHGRGPSRRETILSAAQKGFANRAYEQVYAEYKNIVEEVVRAEKVPSGYKYYVKRYFQKIKPHSME
jgi:chemotaxis protein histidine kinase CheA